MNAMLGLIILGSVLVKPAYAALWQTPDQEGQALMKKGLYAAAQQKFQRLDWRATAAFRGGDYQHAAQDYLALHSLEGFYNAGNALAKLGQYQKAISAYDQALAIDPQHQDAAYNRRLVQALLKKTQQQPKPAQDKRSASASKQAAPPPTEKASQRKSQAQKTGERKPEKNKDTQEALAQNPKPALSQADNEQKKADEQWLQLIPDDPGGLLRQKFLRDHLKRQEAWSP